MLLFTQLLGLSTVVPVGFIGCTSQCRPSRAGHRAVITMFEPLSDAAVLGATAALLCAAGYLQYTLSTGDQGINAFLMKEKSQNPFYSKNFKAERPMLPSWLRGFRLPRFDFVEVYGAEPQRPPSGPADEALEALYTALDDALEVEDYSRAAIIKARIDEASSPRRAPD